MYLLNHFLFFLQEQEFLQKQQQELDIELKKIIQQHKHELATIERDCLNHKQQLLRGNKVGFNQVGGVCRRKADLDGPQKVPLLHPLTACSGVKGVQLLAHGSKPRSDKSTGCRGFGMGRPRVFGPAVHQAPFPSTILSTVSTALDLPSLTCQEPQRFSGIHVQPSHGSL